MTRKRPSLKLTKQELAEALAEALNQLNDLRATFGDEFSLRQENDFHTLTRGLMERNDDIRGDYANNGTLDARDLI